MDLKELIYQQETSLLKKQNRSSSEYINKTLTDDFKEFGSSGKIHALQDVINWLKHEDEFSFEISNFEMEQLSETVALVTYQIRINNSISNRSSIWVFEQGIWKMKFHQGTRAN